MPKNAKHFHFLRVLVELKAFDLFSFTILMQPIFFSMLIFRFNILFCFENTLRFCCRFIMKRKHKNKVNNRSLNRSVKYAKR